MRNKKNRVVVLSLILVLIFSFITVSCSEKINKINDIKKYEKLSNIGVKKISYKIKSNGSPIEKEIVEEEKLKKIMDVILNLKLKKHRKVTIEGLNLAVTISCENGDEYFLYFISGYMVLNKNYYELEDVPFKALLDLLKVD